MTARKKGGKKRKKSRKRQFSHRVRIKRAVKKAAKTIWKHFVELPEKERNQNLATIQRLVKKKLKWKKNQGENRNSKREDRKEKIGKRRAANS